MKNKLPEGWKEVSINDIALVDSGQGAPQGEKWFDGDNIFVRAGDLNQLSDGKYVGDYCQKLNNAAIEKYNLKKYPANSVVFPKSGMSVKTDNIALLKYDSYVVNHLAVIQTQKNDIHLSKYIYYLLKQVRISNLSKNDSYPSIRLDDIKKFKITMPQESFIQKIVVTLEKAEQLKQWRQESDKLTDEYLKSVFMMMFGDPNENPKKWKKDILENNCNRICVSYVGPCDKYYTSQDKGVPMIRTGNLKENHLDLNDLKYVSNEFHEKNIKSQLHFGDLLIARHGTNGQAALVPENLKVANCLNVVIIRTNKEKYNPIFLQWLFNSASTLHQISRKTGGSTQSVINTHAIQKLNLIVPPLPLQQKFASIVQLVEEMKDQQKHSKEQIENIFYALMQKAFRGELNC